MDKRVFDDAIGEVPPTTIDVEAVITRGRRADRIRRVANPAVAAGVAVVLAVGAIAFTTTGGDDQSGGIGVGGQPGTSTESSAPTPSGSATNQTPTSGSGVVSSTGEVPPPAGPTPTPPEACSRTDLETGAEVVARVSPVAKAAFQAQRPDVQLTTNSGNQYPDGVSHGPLDFFHVTGEAPVDMPICGEESYFLARASTTGPEGKGNITMVLQPAYYDSAGDCEPLGNGGEQTFCEKLTGTNGDNILKETRALEGGTTMTRVDIVRPDGTQVTVFSEDIDTSIKTGDAPTATAPPLNHDQLIAIATDPGMTLFP